MNMVELERRLVGNRVTDLVMKLLDSALSRGTEQGVVVFRKAMELLGDSNSPEEVVGVLATLNKALAGIEAHGYLTTEEFVWVEELRAIEQDGGSQPQ